MDALFAPRAVTCAATAVANAVAPSAPALNVVDRLRLELIGEVLDLLASYARCAAEAAWRDDRLTLGLHLKQARLSLIEALRTFKELGSWEIRE